VRVFASPFLLYRGIELKRQTFYNLITWLRVETGLRDSRFMRLKEKLAIFLYIYRTEAGLDNTKLVFGREPNTILRSALFIKNKALLINVFNIIIEII
jgi:hypothetical protein